MNELFFNAVTNRRRNGLPALLSVVLHGAFLVLAIWLSLGYSLPKARSPQGVSVVDLVFTPQKSVRVNNDKARTSATGPPRMVANHTAAVNETVEYSVVKTAGFDPVVEQPSIEYGRPIRFSESGLDLRTAGGTQPGMGGSIGPTNAFNQYDSPGHPARPPIQHGSDEAARLLSAPTPVYTEEARRLNVTGEVVLEVKMTVSGEVQVRKVLRGLGHGLDQAAIDAVNQTRCRPAVKAGHPVDVIATVRVIFKLA